MNLLDLPPELFGSIITHYVNHVGVCAAYNRRDVCRTFHAYLMREIFGQQPLAAFMDRPRNRNIAPSNDGRLFLSWHLDDYLEYQASTEASKMFLPSLVRDVTEKLLSVRATSEIPHIRRLVADAVAQYCFEVWKLATRDPTKRLQWWAKFSDDTTDAALCVAVALKSKKLTDRLIEDGASVWQRTATFGMPLEVALVTQNPGIIELVIRHMERSQTSVAATARTKLLSENIMADAATSKWKPYHAAMFAYPAVDGLNSDGVDSRLVGFYINNVVNPSPEVSEILCGWCIRLANESLLNNLLKKKITPKLRDEVYPRTYFSHPPNQKMCQVFMDSGVLDTRKSYSIPGVGQYSFLYHAVKHNHMALVLSALYAGANADAFGHNFDLQTSESALRRALDDRNQDLVKLLLQHGADPDRSFLDETSEAGCNLEIVNFSDLPGYEHPSRSLLLDAIDEKVTRLKDNYTIPRGHEQCCVAYLPFHTMQKIPGYRV